MVILREEDHRYFDSVDGGDEYVSVTKVIYPLVNFENINKEVLDNAAQRGTAVHAICDQFDKGELDMSRVDKELIPYLGAWVNFVEQSGIKFTALEKIVFNKKKMFAGRLDRVGSIGHKKYVIDIKTGKEKQHYWGVQLAAYRSCLESWRMVESIVVQLKDDETYRVISYPDYCIDLLCFYSCLDIYRWKESHERSK